MLRRDSVSIQSSSLAFATRTLPTPFALGPTSLSFIQLLPPKRSISYPQVAGDALIYNGQDDIFVSVPQLLVQLGVCHWWLIWSSVEKSAQLSHGWRASVTSIYDSNSKVGWSGVRLFVCRVVRLPNVIRDVEG